MCAVRWFFQLRKTRQSPATFGTLSWRHWCTATLEEVLQPLLTEANVGKVALSCHFACEALCAELYDWDEVERG